MVALPLTALKRRKAVQKLRKSIKFLSAKVHNNRVNPDVGLPIQSFTQPPQKTAGQARSKSNPRGGNKQGSPAQRAGSLAGNTLPSVTKIKSAARVSK